MTHCAQNRQGSEATECYLPVEDCESSCVGVTSPCAVEVTNFTGCQLEAGASLVCRYSMPRVGYLDGVCLDEKKLWDECECEARSLPCAP